MARWSQRPSVSNQAGKGECRIMTAHLKAADKLPEELLPLITRLHCEENSPPIRCWIEAPDGWAFDWWLGGDSSLRWCAAGRLPEEISTIEAVQRSQAGRLFAPDGELRWRTTSALGDACCRIVFLGAADWVGDALEDHSTLLESLEQARTEQFLWGQQTQATAGEWIELRIPHRFRYPIEGNPRGVKLVTEYWIDEVGEPQFTRLCDLKPFEETL